MGKYSENPIDNIQGYLGNIEMMLERMEKQQKEQAAAPSPSSDGSELEELKEELSSIRTAIDTIRNDNGLISSSMKTVAGAIGTIPTEEERKRLHQDDLQYIIDNTKKQVTVGLDPETTAKLDKISGGINDFKTTVNNAGNIVSKSISNAAEKAAEKATSNVTFSKVENWFWRIIFLIGGLACFVIWLYPQIEDIHFPNGALGILYTVLAILIVPLLFIGTYKWGKANGGSWY